MNKVAIYDLSKMPTTYDFAAWAVLAKSHGCDHVHFIADRGMAQKKYSPTIGWRRFGNILIPTCALTGMTYSVGSGQEGWQFSYHYGHVEQFYRENGHVAKLQQTYAIPQELPYVTITLRESFRNQWRNCNAPAWAEFRKYLESRGKRVVVFPECEISPLDVEYRMAMYAGDEMNYGASNGPLVLCHLSDAPYITLNMTPENNTGKGYDLKKLMAAGGFPEGSQFSFRNDRQILVYEPDTFENIVKAHEAMFSAERIAA